ncbi:MFS transporter [Streptomyces sp. NPDC057565]|uniref:MFS transporter n=1 Tax=Streptomyces sp. NPDC057565 TaxID=3346169 RepID=UPI003681160B
MLDDRQSGGIQWLGAAAPDRVFRCLGGSAHPGRLLRAHSDSAGLDRAVLPGIVTRIIAGPISDRMGRCKPIVLVAGLVMAASLVILWVLPTASGTILMAAFLGIGIGAYQSVDQALMTEVLPSKETFGKDLGILNIGVMLP